MQLEPSHNNGIILMLRSERRIRGLSQRKLAKMIGCDPSVLTKWEFGVTSPTLDRLNSWASALGFDLEIIPRVE